MASIFRSRLFRGVDSYIIAATSFSIMCYGVLLIAVSLKTNTSSGGSTLVFISGLILLALFGAIFTIWLVHWRVQLRTPTERAD